MRAAIERGKGEVRPQAMRAPRGGIEILSAVAEDQRWRGYLHQVRTQIVREGSLEAPEIEVRIGQHLST